MTKKTFIITSSIFLFVIFLPVLQAKEDLAKKAHESMDLLNYRQAVKYYGQAILEKPLRKGIRVKQAYAYFRLREYEDALRVLEEELALFPDNYDAFILLSHVYFSQGKLKEATRICLEFNQTLENAVREKAKENGIKLTRLKDRDEFLEDYESLVEKVREKNQNFGLPDFILGFHHKKSGNFEKAIRNFHLAIQRKYDPVECSIQLIDIELNKKDWQEALTRSSEAIWEQGEQSEFYFLMGYAFSHIGEMEKAVSCFQRAVELKPFRVEAIRNLAKIYFNKEDFGQAVPLFKKILKLIPYDYQAKFLLERALEEKSFFSEEDEPRLTKDFVDEVDLKYKYVFRENINSVVKKINQYALTLVRSGQLNRAVKVIKSFLEINDTSPELNYNLAQLYNILNVLKEALKYAWRAIELKNDYRDAYDLAANTFFKMEDCENSIKAYEEVISIDPKDAMGYYNLGCAYLAAQNFPKAEENWKNAIQREKRIKRRNKEDQSSVDELDISLTVLKRPVSFEAHKSLGNLYLRQNLHEKALEEFKNAIALEPADPEPYYEIGKIYKDQKKATDAIEYFKKYLYLGGKKEQEVKEILNKLKKRLDE
jgi:tetratricopeptide (TPR) repeat protein